MRDNIAIYWAKYENEKYKMLSKQAHWFAQVGLHDKGKNSSANRIKSAAIFFNHF